jgi:transposase InsO family protein
MCKSLGISKSQIYYQKKEKTQSSEKENEIIMVFKESRKIYGSRKIKAMLQRKGLLVSRRKIREIMKKYNLVSKYTKKEYKNIKNDCTNSEVPNLVNREFNNRKPLEVIISDLTYVRVLSKWAYVCLIVDLFNREIVGSSCGYHKNDELVEEAIVGMRYDLNEVEIFHSDRGKEFDNFLLDIILDKYEIARSLSGKGNPYDNAVAETTYKAFKTEFCNTRVFNSLEELKLELFDYINWYNNVRIHGSLGYLSPAEYKLVLNNSV